MKSAKRSTYSLLWLGALLLLAACTAMPFVPGSGQVVTQEFDYTDFDKVEINDAFAVQIRQGDGYQVTIEVNKGALSYLDIRQRGDTLEIGMRPRTVSLFWFLNWRQRAEITMPSLVAVTANDASHVRVSGFRSDDEAHFDVSDASTLEGELDTGDTSISASDASRVELEGERGDVEIEASDASKVTLTGEGRNVTIEATSASRVDLSDFSAQDATIEAHDASSVTVDVAGRLDAEAEDASNIVYYGDPTLGNTRSRDGSSINARQH